MADKVASLRSDPLLISRDARFFWEGAAQNMLMAQQCGGCGKYWHPPRPVCPVCHSLDQRHVQLSGRGTVYSWVVVRYPAPFGFDTPPIVALVDLEEGGMRLITNIVGADLADMKVGLPVTVAFEKTMSGGSVPVFRLKERTAP